MSPAHRRAVRTAPCTGRFLLAAVLGGLSAIAVTFWLTRPQPPFAPDPASGYVVDMRFDVDPVQPGKRPE